MLASNTAIKLNFSSVGGVTVVYRDAWFLVAFGQIFSLCRQPSYVVGTISSNAAPPDPGRPAGRSAGGPRVQHQFPMGLCSPRAKRCDLRISAKIKRALTCDTSVYFIGIVGGLGRE